MEPSRAEEHQAGRRAREVYRYFRPERLGTIQGNTSSSAEPGLGSKNITPAKHSGNLQQFSEHPTWAPIQPMPESLILGDANETLNSLAQLAALRLNVDRVFIR